jgi:hypothetical protein
MEWGHHHDQLGEPRVAVLVGVLRVHHAEPIVQREAGALGAKVVVQVRSRVRRHYLWKQKTKSGRRLADVWQTSI